MTIRSQILDQVLLISAYKWFDYMPWGRAIQHVCSFRTSNLETEHISLLCYRQGQAPAPLHPSGPFQRKSRGGDMSWANSGYENRDDDEGEEEELYDDHQASSDNIILMILAVPSMFRPDESDEDKQVGPKPSSGRTYIYSSHESLTAAGSRRNRTSRSTPALEAQNSHEQEGQDWCHVLRSRQGEKP